MQDLVQLDFLQTLIEDELEPFDVYGDFFHCNGVDYIVSGHNDEIETYIFLKKVRPKTIKGLFMVVLPTPNLYFSFLEKKD